MKFKKVLGILLSGLLVFGYAMAFAGVSKGERIVYAISPIGRAEYNDMGLVDYKGKKLWLVTFLTRVPGFRDLEKIYADPQSGLPLIVERYIHWPLSEEFLIEEYDPQNNSQVTRRFLKDKLTNEYKYKSNGPYYNAILLPFYLRGVKDLNIGWSMVVRVPEEFTVTLQDVEKIKFNGKIIAAYHFTSKPDKFEIWITKDEELLPVIIKGTAGYRMLMRRHSLASVIVSPEDRRTTDKTFEQLKLELKNEGVSDEFIKITGNSVKRMIASAAPAADIKTVLLDLWVQKVKGRALQNAVAAVAELVKSGDDVLGASSIASGAAHKAEAEGLSGFGVGMRVKKAVQERKAYLNSLKK